MLKSLTALLLLSACLTFSHAGCVNRGAQNSLRVQFERAFKCVDNCFHCQSPMLCTKDRNCFSWTCYYDDSLAAPINDDTPVHFPDGPIDDTPVHFPDDPIDDAPVYFPPTRKPTIARTHGCVDDCSVCSRGSFCAWDPLSCPNKRFPYKCDRGYKAPVAPQHIASCVQSCGFCPYGTRCQRDPDYCSDIGYPPMYTYSCER
ncbi:MAG: hypothetical protein J3Q66DRAFT_391194 [Benniella sp.]|nr:MAG: hypothetical protein J3Q66DRAFT_391194 [Benniella sp.]